MADVNDDPFASIIAHCRYSSSQEELLQKSNFARVADAGISPPSEDYGGFDRKLYAGGDIEGVRGGNSVVVVGGCGELGNLGFGGKRKSAEKLGECGRVEGESSSIPSSNEAVVHWRGRMVFEGDAEIKLCCSLDCAVPDSVEETEKLEIEGCGECELEEIKVMSQVNTKLEFGGDTEVIGAEEEEGDGFKVEKEMRCVDGMKVQSQDKEMVEVMEVDEDEVNVRKEDGYREIRVSKDHGGEGSGNVEKGDVPGEMMRKFKEVIKRQDKRVLPPSLFCQWGEGEGKVGKDGTQGGTKRDHGELSGGSEGERSGKLKKDNVKGGITIEPEPERQVKRKLPSSMFGERGDVEVNVDTDAMEVGEDERNAEKEDGSQEVMMCKDHGERSENREEEDVHTEVMRMGEDEGNVNEEDGTSTFIVKKDHVVSGESNNGENRGSGEEEDVRRHGKGELPQPMIEQWGKGAGVEKGSGKNASVKGNGVKNSKGGEDLMKCILDVLKLLASKTNHSTHDDEEVDFLETAKRRGMTFPQPRFRSRRE